MGFGISSQTILSLNPENDVEPLDLGHSIFQTTPYIRMLRWALELVKCLVAS